MGENGLPRACGPCGSVCGGEPGKEAGMGRRFVIADTHFGDTGNIIRYEERPFENGEEMDRALMENWNRVVGAGDSVYHLGDFACGADREKAAGLLAGLNGRKILIMGNHDQWMTPREWREAGFEEAYPLPIILDGFYLLSHEPLYVTMAAPYANLFGHVHRSPAYRGCSARSFCACVERTGYAPVLFDTIKERIRQEDRKWNVK